MDRPSETNQDSPARMWGLREIVYASLASLGLIVVAGGVVLVGVVVWSLLSETDPTDAPIGVVALLLLGLELLMVPPAWFWGPRKVGGGWRALGFRSFAFFSSLGQMALAFVLMIAVNAGWELLRERLGWEGQPDILPMFGGGARGLALALLVGGLAAPLAEEIFFRGFVYAGLRHRWGVGWALVVSGAVFALVHVIPGVMLPIFVMGVAFALVYQWSGSIWPCIILHSAINCLAFTVAYIQEVSPSLSAGL